MKQAIDFFPLLVFIAVFYLYRDMILVTQALIIATVIQVAVTYAIWKKVEKMHLITLAVVLVLGGATVMFQDERFVKWKPTAVYWIFAVVLLVSHFVGEKNVTQRLLGALLDKMVDSEENEAENQESIPSELVPESLWRKLNLSWFAFFASLGLINIYVAYMFSDEVWVNFKVFGVTAANFVFFLAQFPFLIKYLPEEKQTENENPE